LRGLQGSLEGEYEQVIEKNQNVLKSLKHIGFKSDCDADSEYDISFRMNPCFLDENKLGNSQKIVKIREKPAFLGPYNLYYSSPRVFFLG
jgi:hypothetical protein